MSDEHEWMNDLGILVCRHCHARSRMRSPEDITFAPARGEWRNLAEVPDWKRCPGGATWQALTSS